MKEEKRYTQQTEMSEVQAQLEAQKLKSRQLTDEVISLKKNHFPVFIQIDARLALRKSKPEILKRGVSECK